jgi:hypothetical protein
MSIESNVGVPVPEEENTELLSLGDQAGSSDSVLNEACDIEADTEDVVRVASHHGEPKDYIPRLQNKALSGVGRLSDIIGPEAANEYFDRIRKSREIMRRLAIKRWGVMPPTPYRR